jgi:hypothetical protein
MKQTAVEWLVEQILTEVQNYEDGDIENEWEEPFKHEYVNKYIGMIDLSEFVIKAKEMEKEQMNLCYKVGVIDGNNGEVLNFEQYYKQTFNTKI